jgi:hypothetical protein
MSFFQIQWKINDRPDFAIPAAAIEQRQLEHPGGLVVQ